MQLNHMHLSVTDVAAAAAFFVKHFNFVLLETRGNQGLAVLKGKNNVVLVLMRLANSIDPDKAYPPLFHLGFLTPDEAQVDTSYAAMKADALDVSDIELTRGARRFYCKAPGGILVEVGHEPVIATP
jgi:catechol 2,3-dioxygenase-like lactoylglutathione lyase family enzyme